MRKKRKRKRTIKNPYDKHHIFYIRKEWNKGGLDKLRLHPYCIIPVHRETLHRYIHTHLAYIPTPRKCMVEEVLFHLEYLKKYGAITQEDTLEKRLEILIALFECAEQPTADALKEQLKLVHEFNNKKAPQ